MEGVHPNPWFVLPFVALLAMIALGPLFFSAWWGKHYPKVALGLAAITLCYYLFGLHATESVLHTGHEYISFIALIGALYVVSGGIHINVKGEATPLVNVVFLLVGAVLANFLGTTGASMLLIRPWIRMNKYRITAHHIVFFILIISNVGGSLTPIGDPPLFLGYLKGVPFWWVAEQCWPMWMTGVGVLLVMFFFVDTRNYLRAPKAIRARETQHEEWRFDGLGNVLFLAIILAAVFINRPIFLRESIMIVAAVASYFLTKKDVHNANDFNFHPIKEVAILFIGIFATMLPALDWLQEQAQTMRNPSITVFYAGSGLLSSVLDNAPTYLSFLKMIFGAFVNMEVVQQVETFLKSGGTDVETLVGPNADAIRNTIAALKAAHPNFSAKSISTDEIQIAYIIGNAAASKYLVAISIGSVFFGANTYIGNGPNFMVKAIADHSKVNTPSFMGYIFRYTLPFMVPMLLIVWLLFFRH